MANNTTNFSINLVKLINNNETEISKQVELAKSFVSKYIIPCICLFGMLTNSINLIMFSNKKSFKNKLYRYLQAHSAIDFVYLTISFLFFIFKLEVFSRFNKSYSFKALEMIVFFYATSSLAITMILIEIIVAFKRVFITLNYTFFTRYEFKMKTVLFSCLSFSFLFSLSILLSFKIRPIDSNTNYFNNSISNEFKLSYENIERFKALRIGLCVYGIFRGIFAPFVLFILNIILIQKYRNLIKRKARRKMSKRSSGAISKFFNPISLLSI